MKILTTCHLCGLFWMVCSHTLSACQCPDFPRSHSDMRQLFGWCLYLVLGSLVMAYGGNGFGERVLSSGFCWLRSQRTMDTQAASHCLCFFKFFICSAVGLLLTFIYGNCSHNSGLPTTDQNTPRQLPCCCLCVPAFCEVIVPLR